MTSNVSVAPTTTPKPNVDLQAPPGWTPPSSDQAGLPPLGGFDSHRAEVEGQQQGEQQGTATGNDLADGAVGTDGVRVWRWKPYQQPMATHTQANQEAVAPAPPSVAVPIADVDEEQEATPTPVARKYLQPDYSNPDALTDPYTVVPVTVAKSKTTKIKNVAVRKAMEKAIVDKTTEAVAKAEPHSYKSSLLFSAELQA